MSKKILIDTTNTNETRIAVTENGKLDDFEIETTKNNAVKGDVYLAKITRIEPSLQAAFVDFGKNRNGFLPLTEIHPDYFKIPAADEKKIKELNEKIFKRDNADDQTEDEDDIVSAEENENEEKENDNSDLNKENKNKYRNKNKIINPKKEYFNFRKYKIQDVIRPAKHFSPNKQKKEG